jgi:hypothetical protein
MTNSQHTENYCSYFEKQLQQIRILDDRLHKKVLLLVILDTLGRARYPDEKSNKLRFIKVVRDHIKWKDNSRVSLCRILELIHSHNLSRLGSFARESIGRWKDWEMHDISDDPLSETIQNIAGDEQEKKLMQDSTHMNLLYAYRNHLIHEFREPGKGMEMDQRDTSPYYHRMTHILSNRSHGRETWELVYPLGFFVTLTESCLQKLKQHLLQNDLNPYSFYEFGTVWKVRV